MRVLVINTTPLKKGGITNVIFNLLENIDKTELTFDMIVSKTESEDLTERFRAQGGEVFFVPRSIRKAVQYIFAVKKLIKKNGYDIVHIHGNSHTVVLELLAARIAGCKVRIVHAHSTKCNDLKLHKVLTGLFHRLCTHNVACGKDAGKFMFGEKPFTVINNGIDLEKFRFTDRGREALKEKYNLAGKTVIGHIGMFNDIKNQDFLLEVLADILKTDPNYALVMVGDGERRELIAQKAKEMGIADSVVFTGLTDKVAEHLSLFDVFTLPSFFEGLPLVLVEAQASGIYSIASDRVTKEADKTGNMSFLSIDKGSRIWAEEILKRADNKNREEASDVAIKNLKEKGYSAKDEAEKLLNFYKYAVKGE